MRLGSMTLITCCLHFRFTRYTFTDIFAIACFFFILCILKICLALSERSQCNPFHIHIIYMFISWRHVVVVSKHSYNTSSDDIYQEMFNCTGNETKLVHCPRYSVRCPSESKAAIVCGIVYIFITSHVFLYLSRSTTCQHWVFEFEPRTWHVRSSPNIQSDLPRIVSISVTGIFNQ